MSLNDSFMNPTVEVSHPFTLANRSLEWKISVNSDLSLNVFLT